VAAPGAHRTAGTHDVRRDDPALLNARRAGWHARRLRIRLAHLAYQHPHHLGARVRQCRRVIGSLCLQPGLAPRHQCHAEGFTWQELVLPTAVLVLYDFGYVTRMTRASMSAVMHTDYIRTAVLKGLPWHVVILKHALRNALITPFTVIMLQINWLLSGVIVVEFFFAYKGFGALLLEASLNQDIYLIEACTLVAVGVAVVTQTLADIGYIYLNPQLRGEVTSVTRENSLPGGARKTP